MILRKEIIMKQSHNKLHYSESKNNNIFLIGQPKFHCNPKEDLERREIWDDSNSMNEDLIEYWNEKVSKEDTVFVVGELIDSNSTSIINELNGNIILVRNRNDSLTKYVDDKLITTLLVAELIYNNKSIYITNYLEHINTVESNLIITSDESHLLNKINDKSMCYRDSKEVVKFINNLSIPVFNLNIKKWNYKPVNLEEIIKSYSDYQRHYTN